MNFVNNGDNLNKVRKSIVFEYLFVILIMLFVNIIYPVLYNYMIGDNIGLDGIGQALGISLILSLLELIMLLLFFIVNPIRIVILRRKELKYISSKSKKIIYIIVIIFPILFSLFLILREPISNFISELNFEYNSNSYSLTYEEYKTPKDFYKELDKRGFIFDSHFDLERMSKKYENVNSKYYYEKATVMPLTSDFNHFYDSKDYNNVISFDDDTKAPGYIYNTILYLHSKDENLKYLPISRYDVHNYLVGNFYPFYEDYYIECKILYVDDDFYAIIGVGQSYNIEKYFKDNKNDDSKFYTYPYNMIISEKDNITTFVDGKYYPNGVIVNEGNRFEMIANPDEKYLREFYEIKKVDKVDVATINNIANELKNGVLKESIEYHFNK